MMRKAFARLGGFSYTCTFVRQLYTIEQSPIGVENSHLCHP